MPTNLKRYIDDHIVNELCVGSVSDIPNDTIVYVHIDTSSLSIEDQEDVKELSENWYYGNGLLESDPNYIEGFINENPDFEGDFIVNKINTILDPGTITGPEDNIASISNSSLFTFYNEGYYTELWLQNPVHALLRKAYLDGITNFNSDADFLSWSQDRSVIVLSFVDEAELISDELYHNRIASSYSGGTNGDEPTDRYINDYNNFVNEIHPRLNFFKGVLYPVVRIDGDGNPLVEQIVNSFQLHALSAIEARVMTVSEIDDIFGVDKVALYGTTRMQDYFYNNLAVDYNSSVVNPYETEGLTGLKGLGWDYDFSKYSPISDVLDSGDIQNQLDDLLVSNEITYTPCVNDHYNLWAYNHNYFSFKAVNMSTGDYAEITYNDVKYTLYPDVDGVFIFDTYEFSRELFSYKDDYTYLSNSIDNNQFKLVSFNIDLYLNDGFIEGQTLDVTFYNGVVQRWQSPVVLDYQSDILKPVYFNGYPFDYSVITNTDVTRTLPSDLSLFNVIDNTNNCDGVYLKYHNGKAGYDYYLFNTYSKGNYSTSSYGSIKEKFSWVENTLEIGKKGQRQILAFAKIPYEYREMMHDLADSNEVYIFTGNKGDIDLLETPEGIGVDVIGSSTIGVDMVNQVNDISNKWLEVKIDKMKVQDSNKESAFEQNVTILLPEEQTRTRI